MQTQAAIQTSHVAMKPTYSIITPVYNEKRSSHIFINETIAIMEHLGETFELIIV